MTQLLALYKVLAKTQLTKGRLLLVAAFAVVSMAVAATIGANSDLRIDGTIQFIAVFGLALMVPVLSLVTASSAFGQLVEDETLVYLWLRPSSRWSLAVAAWMSALTLALPATVVPLMVAAAIGTDGDTNSIVATGLAVALASIAYTAMFTFVGLMIRRALVWGLVYVFIWELFVAQIGAGAAKLAIGTYPSSVIARISEVELPLADYSMTVSVLVPLVVAAFAMAITTYGLKWIDVD